MTALAWLIPAALTFAALGLAAFIWSLKSGQFDDLDGAAYRILDDDEERLHANDKTHRHNQPPPRHQAL